MFAWESVSLFLLMILCVCVWATLGEALILKDNINI